MKAISAAFKTMLQTSQTLMVADLYTITLLSGSVLYYTDAPANIVYGGNTFLAAAPDAVPGLGRGPTKMSRGLQVETLAVDIFYDGGTLIMGRTPGSFANAGGFDGARVKVDKFLTPSLADVSRGIVNLFTGVVSDVSAGSGKVTMNVSSDLIFLSAAFPRNYFLPQDNNALFSVGNGLSKAAWAVNATVTSGTATTITASTLTQAADWFALGYVVINTGANAGLIRTVKAFSGTVLTLLYPLPSPCAAGDTLTAYPGYDGTQAQAGTKFSNLANFRGFPFVPTPEVIELGQNGSPPADNGGGGAGLGGGGGGGIGRGAGGQSGRFLQR
jgi:uncharacterized phage protein (TIGR02218 family)